MTEADRNFVVTHRDTLNKTFATQVLDLCTLAAKVDGTPPLNEHALLHIRHFAADGAAHAEQRHVLALSPARSGQAGSLVGYAYVDLSDPTGGPTAELVVHPAWRRSGIATRLVGEVLQICPDRDLKLWAHGQHPGASALAAAFDFTCSRALEQWRRSLAEPLPEITFPAAVRVRSFQPGLDNNAWLALNARAFADHPEQGDWTETDLLMRLSEPWFDAAGFLVAEHDGVPIAFHWTKVHAHGSGAAHAHAPIGEVYVVGVDPAWQGHGLGRAITVAGLRRLASQGLQQALLYVDGDNVAAKTVYTALGFRPWTTDVLYVRQA